MKHSSMDKEILISECDIWLLGKGSAVIPEGVT